jgi:hypothetical protein
MIGRFALVISGLLMGVSGCRPSQRNLSTADVDGFRLDSGNATIAQVQVKDLRPIEEDEDLHAKMRYFVPALIWWQWATEGNVRPDAEYYSKDIPGEMQQLLEKALINSGLMVAQSAASATRLTLSVEILHLYGVTHVSSRAIVTYAAASNSVRKFHPYGFAAARIILKDSTGGTVAERYVSGYSSDTYSGEREDLTNQLTFATLEASGNLASNIVRALDPVFSLQGGPTSWNPAISAFVISRATKNGLQIERAVIDFQSGVILTSEILQRKREPFAAVDEWVVDPYQGGESMLRPQDYDTLINRLKTAYDVRYLTNVRVAHIFGPLPGTAQANAEIPPPPSVDTDAPPVPSLSRDDVQRGMAGVAPKVFECGQGSGGSIVMNIKIGKDGRVASAEPAPNFKGTPIGNCAIDALSQAVFPKSLQELTVSYPFNIR